ncbi:MAG TPA: DUF2490 domain-containing protein [Gemmatimonadaceae bacterium]|nr:DUF2490 domain-containing protein [Gemmatimonadaceae bacterium]
MNNAMVWGGIFGDHRFAPKTSLYWDYQARRAEAGEVWQIQLGSVGVTRDLSKQWRATAALGWSLGYRYGEFAAAANSAELRPWVQVTGTRPVGSFTWSDRTRAEFRVIRAVGEFAPEDADWAPTVVRLRRMDRLTHKLSSDGRWYGTASQEFLVRVHPARARVGMLEQMRTQALIGRQLTQHNRVEVGYGLQRFNFRGGFEMNHTLLVYYRTGVPFR